jgi:hypothetical protein
MMQGQFYLHLAYSGPHRFARGVEVASLVRFAHPRLERIAHDIPTSPNSSLITPCTVCLPVHLIFLTSHTLSVAAGVGMGVRSSACDFSHFRNTPLTVLDVLADHQPDIPQVSATFRQG